MIYEAMKWLVEWLTSSYKCECGSNVSEKDIDIVWAAWNTVNFDIVCPNCSKHWIVKSQIVLLDTNGLAEVKHSIETIKDKLSWGKETVQISDTEITSLSKDLKEKQIQVSDLFN